MQSPPCSRLAKKWMFWPPSPPTWPLDRHAGLLGVGKQHVAHHGACSSQHGLRDTEMKRAAAVHCSLPTTGKHLCPRSASLRAGTPSTCRGPPPPCCPSLPALVCSRGRPPPRPRRPPPPPPPPSAAPHLLVHPLSLSARRRMVAHVPVLGNLRFGRAKGGTQVDEARVDAGGSRADLWRGQGQHSTAPISTPPATTLCNNPLSQPRSTRLQLHSTQLPCSWPPVGGAAAACVRAALLPPPGRPCAVAACTSKSAGGKVSKELRTLHASPLASVLPLSSTLCSAAHKVWLCTAASDRPPPTTCRQLTTQHPPGSGFTTTPAAPAPPRRGRFWVGPPPSPASPPSWDWRPRRAAGCLPALSSSSSSGW